MTLRQAAFLVTEDAGTHEYTRVYVLSGGKCKAGDRYDQKIGPAVIHEVRFDTGIGLTMVTSRGTMFASAGECYANWLTYEQEAAVVPRPA